MNNLSRILKIYFVDANFDDIVNSYFKIGDSKKSPEKGMSDNEFVKSFFKDDFVYGFDVAKAINRFALSCDTSSNCRDFSVFNILANATKDMLLYKNDEPVCKQDAYLRWNEISRIVGEDLLTLSYLANDFSHYPQIDSFAWKPFIQSDSIAINDILNKGLYELHSHVNGASLNIDVNWLALMNATQMDKKWNKNLSKEFPSELIIAKKAIAIRFFLFSKIQGNNPDINALLQILKCSDVLELDSHLQNCYKNISIQKQDALLFGKNAIDYAIPNNITQRDRERYYNLPLIGERLLLYKVLREIFSSDAGCDDYARLLYAYIVAKNQFRKIIVQCDQIKGFGYFADVQNRKFLFENSDLYRSLLIFMATQTVICNQPIKAMEMRIAPKNTIKELIDDIQFGNKSITDDTFRVGEKNKLNENVKLGYILHFIKKNEPDEIKYSNRYCRNYSVRETVKKQSSVIEELVKSNSPYVKDGFIAPKDDKPKNTDYPIIGIDAASSEFYCRPEVFAPAFRRLKYVPRDMSLNSICRRKDSQLGRTYHVGEDFYDIIDGLRAIDECINFMNFGEGDRIGHGIALGINAREYYKQRDFRIVLPKQNMLDNVVWMFKMMEFYSIPDEFGLKAFLRKIFRELYYEIYSDDFKKFQKLESVSISEYYDSWQLRGDDPETLSNGHPLKPYMQGNHEELNVIRSVSKIMELFKVYHYSGNAKKIGDTCKEFYLHEDYGYDIVVEQIQKKLRERIQNKHISIETNPTSNMQITDVSRYAEHPITVMNNVFLKSDYNSMIDVSINTDDQGVFATSLEKEFTLIALALEKEKKNDGTPLYRKNDIYRWLDMVRDSARPRSFLND